MKESKHIETFPDDQLQVDTDLAGDWFMKTAKDLWPSKEIRRDVGIDNAIRKRLGMKTISFKPGAEIKRKWLIGGRSTWENWKKKKPAGPVYRKRKYLEALDDEFGIDLTVGSELSNSLTNFAKPLSILAGCSAEPLFGDSDEENIDKFLIRVLSLEFEPKTMPVHADTVGLLGNDDIGSAQFGLTSCFLTVEGKEAVIKKKPLITLIEAGDALQEGKCVGVTIRWSKAENAWSLIKKTKGSSMTGSLENGLLCEVSAKSGAQIIVRLEVLREHIISTFAPEILDRVKHSGPNFEDPKIKRDVEPSALESGRNKLMAHILGQRISNSGRFYLSTQRIILE